MTWTEKKKKKSEEEDDKDRILDLGGYSNVGIFSPQNAFPCIILALSR